MADNFWKNYWNRHANENIDNTPLAQVFRTINKKPQSDTLINEHVDLIIAESGTKQQHTVLDLCCGNGYITNKILKKAKSVTGVDFCTDLVSAGQKEYKDIEFIKSDVLEYVVSDSKKFDRIFVNAAIQHLSHQQTIALLKNCKNKLKPGGVIYFSDIPNQDSLWQFYANEDQKKDYFNSIEVGKPIIGSWYCKTWMENLSKYLGFSEQRNIEQPQHFSFSYYRFDCMFKN